MSEYNYILGGALLSEEDLSELRKLRKRVEFELHNTYDKLNEYESLQQLFTEIDKGDKDKEFFFDFKNEYKKDAAKKFIKRHILAKMVEINKKNKKKPHADVTKERITESPQLVPDNKKEESLIVKNNNNQTQAIGTAQSLKDREIIRFIGENQD